MPLSPTTLDASLHVNKSIGSRLLLPGTSTNRIDLNASASTFLSITSGIIQSGQMFNGILRIQNTAFNAVTFANAGTGYVDGPLQRGIVNSNQSYLFPLGKGGAVFTAHVAKT
jgi:hypothetical protein